MIFLYELLALKPERLLKMEIGHWPKELGHRAGWPTRPANPTRPCEHGPLKSVAEWYNVYPRM